MVTARMSLSLDGLAGDVPAAREAYRRAARRTTSLPEQRYLESRGARLGGSTARASLPSS
jgi:hypothetical protein